MAVSNVVSKRYPILTSRGEPARGGSIFLYEPGGTTTQITAYKDSGLTQPHTQPIKLSASGRQSVWITRDADLQILDRNGNILVDEPNVNPTSAGADDSGGLVNNGSFENDSDSDDTPDNWVRVDEAGSGNNIDTTESTDGAQSFQFVNAGNGGGDLTTDLFFPANDVDQLRVEFDILASTAGVRNIVRVEWYDVSQAAISNSDVYDSTSNPTTWTSQNFNVSPPSLARFAKLKLIGCEVSGANGSTNFDRVSVFYPSVVSGVFDNITIQNNQIITTNTNGDLEIAPNGTGGVNFTGAGLITMSGESGVDVNQVRVGSTNAATLLNTGNPLNVGTLSPGSNAHLALSAAAIHAKATGTTAADLAINEFGGFVSIGPQSGSGSVSLYHDGALKLETGAAGIRIFDGDVDISADDNSALLGLVGRDSGGNLSDIFSGDPNGGATVYYDGSPRTITRGNGLGVAGSVDADPTAGAAQTSDLRLYDLSFSAEIASLGFRATSFLDVYNQVHGGGIRLRAEQTGGAEVSVFEGDPDGSAGLYFNSGLAAVTVNPSSGGLFVNNTLTGVGNERVLTTSDLSTGNLATIYRASGSTGCSSTTPTSISGIQHVFPAGTEWQVEIYLHMDSNSSSAANYRFRLDRNAGSVGLNVDMMAEVHNVGSGSAATRGSSDTRFIDSGNIGAGIELQIAGAGATSDDHVLIAHGVIRNAGGSDVTLDVQMGIQTSGSFFVEDGSYMKVLEIA